jgi:hypothetical protein
MSVKTDTLTHFETIKVKKKCFSTVTPVRGDGDRSSDSDSEEEDSPIKPGVNLLDV